MKRIRFTEEQIIDALKRVDNGLTQFDMMDYGFSRRQYQYIESGQRNITLATLHRLAGIFGVQPDTLLRK